MMNLHYGDARNKNNSSGQNKLNKFTTNTYASSLINYTSTFPTLTSSLNSNSYMLVEWGWLFQQAYLSKNIASATYVSFLFLLHI